MPENINMTGKRWTETKKERLLKGEDTRGLSCIDFNKLQSILEDRQKYRVVQIWPGQTVTSLHTISPGHIWTTLYINSRNIMCPGSKFQEVPTRH
jgi:hypothetical protein